MSVILLYGATGYSGRLITAALADPVKTSAIGARVILAGRDGDALAELAGFYGMDFRVFGVDDMTALVLGLKGADVVINAAGPFAPAALAGFDGCVRIAEAAIAVGAHYTDINGDLRTYQRLAQLDPLARAAAGGVGVALVASAGYWSAASDILLEAALTEMRTKVPGPLRSIRLATARILTPSRGSAATVWSVLREDAIVVRRRERAGPAGVETGMLTCAVAAGKLERTFGFEPDARGEPRRAIATVASLVDTLTARTAAEDHYYEVLGIDSYVEAGGVARAAYAVGSGLGPLIATPVTQSLVRASLGLIAAGPTATERAAEPHDLILEIDDRFGARIVEWRWRTPNIYDFTATLAVAVAVGLTAKPRSGWLRPSSVVIEKDPSKWPGCTLERRVSDF